MTLTEGVYCFSSSAQLTGLLTLNAQGSADAVFIFKAVSTLTTASNSSVLVTNGSTGCNVFWQVGSSATIGTTTEFVGNILALTSIALQNGASVSGRALARNGEVTMDTNNVGFSGCTVPTATASATASPTASVTPSPTATAAPTDTATATATPTAAATPPPTATPVGQTPTPTATPVGQTPTPQITPSNLPRTGGPSQGDQVLLALLLAGLVAGSLGACALVLGARARRRGAQPVDR
jgi:type VI secretion system secreted protein VgrG